MEVLSLLGAMTATGLTSIGVAHYLSKRLLDHRLSKDLKDYEANISKTLAEHKADLDNRANTAKVEGEAKLKKEIEEYLGERSAERAYCAEAKKRLYLAVGPLRLQLLVAAAEYTNRVARIGDGQYTYDMSIETYFGQSTAYRLLRVLAISELIERQIAYADFTVDPSMRSLLRFKRQAFLSLSSHQVSLGHPNENWNKQEQHVFYDVLAIIASSLIIQDVANSTDRVMRFDEFSAMVACEKSALRIDPIPRLITELSARTKPILWLRFLALAQLCTGLLEAQGTALGLEIEPINVEKMLKLIEDEHIRANINGYRDALTSFRK